ncbi:Protein TIC 20-v, partial [Durusdinium trenchii]
GTDAFSSHCVLNVECSRSATFARYVNDLLKGSLSAQRIFQERLKWASASPEMKAALVLVDSRSFNLADDQGNVIRALVPLIDLLNTFVPLTSTGSWNCWFRGNLQEGALLQAECPITEGSELVHCYSDFSSPELWATYGFLPLEAMESSHEAPLISLPLGELKLISQAKKILQPRHWLDERTLAFEIPWDAEDGGPLFTVLNCMANGQQDRVQNILRERLQTALLASQQAEEALLAPTSGPHAAFKAALQQAALQLLHNERPLLEEELELLEG